MNYVRPTEEELFQVCFISILMILRCSFIYSFISFFICLSVIEIQSRAAKKKSRIERAAPEGL